MKTDEETGQTLISGMGELHLEIIIDRLMREFKVEADIGKPRLPTAKPLLPLPMATANWSSSPVAAASTVMWSSM